MNLSSIMDTPGAKQLAQEIMVEIGLGDPPSTYNGPSAYEIRVKAANALIPAIAARAAEKRNDISPPIVEIVSLVERIATTLERNPVRLTITREAIWIAICGHLWIGHLIAHYAKPLDRITAKDGVMSRLKELAGHGSMYGGSSCAPSGSCGDDCGGCGSGGGCGGSCNKP